MEWIAYCSVCGELDRAPNGPMMESVARLHRRDTGHMTIIGYEPSIVMGGEMVEVQLGQPVSEEDGRPYSWRVTNIATGKTQESAAGYPSMLDAEGGARTHIATELAGEYAPKAYRVQVLNRQGDIVHTIAPLPWEVVEVPLGRPFPQTFSDWGYLAEEIKKRDPDSAAIVNDRLNVIWFESGDVDGAKRWLVKKAGSLGVK